MLLEFDGTFVFALISFIIFVFLMNLILYRPVTRVIEERQKFFDKNSSTAKESKEKREQILKDKEEQILQAKKEAANLIKETKEGIIKKREEEISKKKAEISNRLQETKEVLQNSKREIKTELKNEIQEYVSLAVSKVLGEGGEIQIEEERINKALEARE